MRIQVKTLPENTTREYNISEPATVEKLLGEMQLKPDAVIAMRNNKPIPLDDRIDEDDKLTLIKIASGG
ncbi:MAG TPA: MoaD/ThiS family protein [Thermoplasmatales archaeon]|nr:MoaD/ThiS family protein [Thermoplasmatales archaeon]